MLLPATENSSPHEHERGTDVRPPPPAELLHAPRASTLMPAPQAYNHLVDVCHASLHLTGILQLLAGLDPAAWHGHSVDRAEWTFELHAEERVIHWQLHQPVPAAGRLHVHGDPLPCQLALAVDIAPPRWTDDDVHTAIHAILAHLCDRLDAEQRRIERAGTQSG